MMPSLALFVRSPASPLVPPSPGKRATGVACLAGLPGKPGERGKRNPGSCAAGTSPAPEGARRRPGPLGDAAPSSSRLGAPHGHAIRRDPQEHPTNPRNAGVPLACVGQEARR